MVKRRFPGTKTRRVIKRRRRNRGRGYPRRKGFLNVGKLLPDKTMVTLKYAEDIDLVVPSVGSDYYFRCNSIYDPNQVAIGHQPMGHDEYAMFYDKYCVVGAKLSVRFVAMESNSDTQDENHITNVGVCTIDNMDGIIDPRAFMENNRTTYSVVSPQRPNAVIRKKFSAKRFFGKNKVVDDHTLSASFGNNPSNEAVWQIKAWPASPENIFTRTLALNVMIQYICVLKERKNLGLS